jgi:hypothetical protein
MKQRRRRPFLVRLSRDRGWLYFVAQEAARRVVELQHREEVLKQMPNDNVRLQMQIWHIEDQARVTRHP